MTKTEHEEAIEKAKIDYHPAFTISNETFTQAAAEILNVPIERVEVRRCILMGDEFGKLTVYLYKEDDLYKIYYWSDNGAIQYTHLSPNIYKFKEELNQKSDDSATANR